MFSTMSTDEADKLMMHLWHLRELTTEHAKTPSINITLYFIIEHPAFSNTQLYRFELYAPHLDTKDLIASLINNACPTLSIQDPPINRE